MWSNASEDRVHCAAMRLGSAALLTALDVQTTVGWIALHYRRGRYGLDHDRRAAREGNPKARAFPCRIRAAIRRDGWNSASHDRQDRVATDEMVHWILQELPDGQVDHDRARLVSHISHIGRPHSVASYKM